MFSRSRSRIAAVITVVLLGGMLSAASATAGAQAFTTAQAVVEVGGTTRIYTQGEITASIQYGYQLQVELGNEIDLAFTGPTESPVSPGTYRNTAPSWYEAQAWWQPSLNYNGERCGRGSFTVHKLTYSGAFNSQVNTLDLSFDYQSCSGNNLRSHGRITLDVPPTPFPVTGPRVLIAEGNLDKPGELRLTATSAAAVKHVSAKLFSLTSGEQVATVSSFVPEGENPNYNTWKNTALVALGQPGFYRIDTEIVDVNDIVVTQTGAGILHYAVKTTLSSALNRTTMTYANQTAVLSGVLRGAWSSSDIRPVAGATVRAYLPQFNSTSAGNNRDLVLLGSAVTSADGSYSLTVAPRRADDVLVAYDGDLGSHVLSADSAPLRVQISPTSMRLSSNGVFWQPTTIVSGTATYLDNGTWVPFASGTVNIEYHNAQGHWGHPAEGTATTDSNGNYSVTVTMESNLTEGYFSVDLDPGDPFIAKGSSRLEIASPYKEGAQFGPVVSEWGFYPGSAVVYGMLTFPASQPAKVVVQLQENVNGTWLTRHTGNAIAYEGAWYFEAYIWVSCGTSKWRAVYGDGVPGVTPPVSRTLTAHWGCGWPLRYHSGPGGVPKPRLLA